MISSFRTIKLAEEIEAIRSAARITDSAMEKVPLIAKPGMTESQLAWELEKLLRETGASELSFPIIVASGPNSARPHHMTGERSLQIGDTIIIDMGAKLNGYCSDLTRSFHIGESKNEQFSNVYDLVLKAQTNALEKMSAGMLSRDIDGLAREIIDEAGFGNNFGHGLGHGVGLDIHENPRLSWTNEDIVESGVVITVEPGIYLPGWGGIRIEDLVQVKDNGVEFLSKCPKKPIIAV
jgi:Xaa-Pro aminopeptidase